MSETDDGGPAFPYVWMGVPGQPPQIKQLITSGGMTIRDYFAAKAMQAILSDLQHQKVDDRKITDQHILAKGAYAVADAMLQARKNGR